MLDKPIEGVKILQDCLKCLTSENITVYAGFKLIISLEEVEMLQHNLKGPIFFFRILRSIQTYNLLKEVEMRQLSCSYSLVLLIINKLNFMMKESITYSRQKALLQGFIINKNNFM